MVVLLSCHGKKGQQGRDVLINSLAAGGGRLRITFDPWGGWWYRVVVLLSCQKIQRVVFFITVGHFAPGRMRFYWGVFFMQFS